MTEQAKQTIKINEQQARRKKLESALTALREEREQLMHENEMHLARTGEPVTLPSERATAPTDGKG